MLGGRAPTSPAVSCPCPDGARARPEHQEARPARQPPPRALEAAPSPVHRAHIRQKVRPRAARSRDAHREAGAAARAGQGRAQSAPGWTRAIDGGHLTMSEYQYYEFLAIDRPLDERQRAELRALSTRAQITATSFVNEYHWGDFRGNPAALMERYFDAFLYFANWGTRQLMIRLPRDLLDLSVAERYCTGDVASAWAAGDHVI